MEKFGILKLSRLVLAFVRFSDSEKDMGTVDGESEKELRLSAFQMEPSGELKFIGMRPMELAGGISKSNATWIEANGKIRR